MKCVSHEKRCIFQVKRCIILVRCINPIWRPPDISGGRHLENEMYISSTKMYISTGEMYYSYRCIIPIEIFISPVEIIHLIL